jgi:hypothetical protein
MGTMKPYVVKQGDFLSKLAFMQGFDASAVWNDPKNADLCKLRPDPDMLAPGDLLYVPDPNPQVLALTGQSSNDYQADVPSLTITVTLKDGDRQVLVDEPYVIEGLGGDPVEGKSGADGSVIISATVLIREVTIVLPNRNLSQTVLVGDLDPLEEDSGVRMRLAQLGYLAHGWESTDDIDDIRAAIEAFQVASGLPDPTGIMDDATRAALGKAHGS